MNLPKYENDERRGNLRMETVFPVRVESTALGFSNCVARNISRSGIMLEARQLIPLGTEIEIHFTPPGLPGGITARAAVKNHYYLHFGELGGHGKLYGMGARFTHFADDGLERLKGSLDRYRTPPPTIH